MSERLADETLDQLEDITEHGMRGLDGSNSLSVILALREAYARVEKLEAELKGANLAADKLNKAYDAARVMLEDTR